MRIVSRIKLLTRAVLKDNATIFYKTRSWQNAIERHLSMNMLKNSHFLLRLFQHNHSSTITTSPLG